MTETSDPLEIGVGAGPVELDWIHVAEVHDDEDDLFIRSEFQNESRFLSSP